ncbi:MAG: hypothetical protein ACYSSL_09525 [Planctomycetota bacterium]|jgi:hypothetical protein
MAKRRGHKALYEVLGNSKLKTSYQKTLEQIEKPEQKPPPPPETPEPEPEQQVSTGWPKKPKIMQFNDKALDLSLPYPLVVTVLIVVILLMLIFFRLGQIAALRSQDAPSQTDTTQNAAVGRLTQPIEQPETTTVKEPPIPGGASVSTGSNRIVIQQYHNRANLEPAKAYFAQYGIDTEILNINNTYFLVSKNKYENPNRKGTDGYNARQRIIKLGANYVAPEGYESFGQKPFHDAYGRRFDE